MLVAVTIIAVAVAAIAILAAVMAIARQGRASDAQLQQQLAAIASGAQLQQQAQQQVQQQLGTMQQSVQAQVQALDARLTASVDGVSKSLSTSLTSTQQTMRSVDTQLGQLSTSTKQMLEVGKDISGLQQMLRAPKPRGQFGELLLERLLEDMLPAGQFTLQHRFKNGQIVDAAIHIGGGIVPVDAKFPDTAFRRIIDAQDDAARTAARRDFTRDVKGHIDAVAKYIVPDEGTFGFAMMYVPAENLYYEMMIRDESGDLQTYAQGKRVIPCSPNSLFAYLQSLVLGLKGLRVEERAHEIVNHLERLNDDFARFRKDFATLGSHISNAHTRFEALDRAATRFSDHLARPLDPSLSPLPLSEGETIPLLPEG
jgi:DNA recombination protein RmuC